MLPRQPWPGVVTHYRARLDGPFDGPVVTLLEGNTPLIPAPRLAGEIADGLELFLKYEGLNPTGSFKDRGMTAAVTAAVAEGSRAVICASTGNTAASAAAYAARAGLTAIVVIPEGKIAMGKLAGAVAYGARVIQIRGSFDDALRLVRTAGETAPVSVVNSVHPTRLQGQKTASFEIVETLGRLPDWLALPVGNAGNITSYWLGFKECGMPGRAPSLLGAQAAGSAPLLAGHPIEQPETLATAIRIGAPARGDQAVTALEESAGQLWSVTDDEIMEAYQLLARREGVFCEPSSAAGVAGLLKSVRHGRIDLRGKTVVAVLTGHGLKDPDSAVRNFPSEHVIEPYIEALLELL